MLADASVEVTCASLSHCANTVSGAVCSMYQEGDKFDMVVEGEGDVVERGEYGFV